MNAQRRIVTFSAGDPPIDDLVQRGIGACHVDDGVLRVARSVLRGNFDIAYAGYLRGDGFTTSLADDTGKVVLGPRFISFLGWPFSENLTTTKIADTMGLCRFVRVEPGVNTQGIEPSSKTPKVAWAMAQATTVTRQLLFSRLPCKDINEEEVGPRVAQVLFAGKSRGFLGVMPGIAQEALCALDANLAVYIVGAFGGAAGLLAESLTGPQLADAFGLDSHRSDPAFERMLEGANEAGHATAPADAFGRLQEVLTKVRDDLSLLRNGLGDDENRQLMLTSDLSKVARLISSGLRNLGDT